MQTFPSKDPGESVNLTFDFSSNLPAGVTLIGPLGVAVSVQSGTDGNPSAILNGTAGFDSSSTKVVQPVTAGISGVTYEIEITSPTTNPTIVLVLPGLLPVKVDQ